jgi:hypothetical protein
MITEFRGYIQPSSDKTVIWRYMDFTKFVDLISKKALFFVKSSNFEDPFEGIYPMKITEGNKVFHKEAARLRDFCYVNCWHMNEHESAAMWNLYLSTQEGVAIKSTSGGLKKAFENCDESILISKVKYWNYEEDVDKLYKETKDKLGSSTINPVVFKRSSFEHEKELRLIYNQFKIGAEEPPKAFGVLIETEMNDLIDEIVIAPYAPSWFFELVADVCKQYGLNKPIIHSNLYSPPKL